MCGCGMRRRGNASGRSRGKAIGCIDVHEEAGQAQQLQQSEQALDAEELHPRPSCNVCDPLKNVNDYSMIIQHIAPPSHAMASSAPSLRERAVAMPARIAAALGTFARRASSDSGSAQASAATGEVCRGALSRPRAAASGVPRVLSISLGGPGSDYDDSGAPAEALCRAANDRGSSNADAATAPATRALCRAPKSRLVSSLPSRIAISDQGACIDLNPNVSFPAAFAFVFADHHIRRARDAARRGHRLHRARAARGGRAAPGVARGAR